MLLARKKLRFKCNNLLKSRLNKIEIEATQKLRADDFRQHLRSSSMCVSTCVSS